MITAHQPLAKIAKRALNPAQIAVSLAWYDRTFSKFYITGHFPMEQWVVDESVFVPEGCSNKVGSGNTIEEAIESLHTQYFGGL